MWRQLTSMRTALFLLLLLAVGAVPGSIWPQRSIDAARTADYIANHPKAGPWLDRLGFFEVYASPWFAAIYLLLFISLVGCVLPRSKVHWKAMRSAPPKAPARPARLPAGGTVEVSATPDEVVEVSAGAVARQAVPARLARRRVGERGEGPPQGDRQPRLPPVADLRHHRRRDRPPLRVEGRRDRAGRRVLRQLPRQLRHLQPGAVGRPGQPLAVRAHRRPARRDLRGERHRAGAVRLAARLHRPRHDHRDAVVARRRSRPSRSTTRWRWTAPGSSSSATATPRSSRSATRRASASTAVPRRSWPRTTTTRRSAW